MDIRCAFYVAADLSCLDLQVSAALFSCRSLINHNSGPGHAWPHPPQHCWHWPLAGFSNLKRSWHEAEQMSYGLLFTHGPPVNKTVGVLLMSFWVHNWVGCYGCSCQSQHMTFLRGVGGACVGVRWGWVGVALLAMWKWEVGGGSYGCPGIKGMGKGELGVLTNGGRGITTGTRVQVRMATPSWQQQ